MKRTVLFLPTLILAVLAGSPAALAGTTSVRYGPYTLPAGMHADPSVIQILEFGVNRPCSDCYITGFKPDLVYGDGSRATMEQGPMLHHAVWASSWNSDATCAWSGERLFASGAELTTIAMPSGYGYRVRPSDSWSLSAELMNHSSSEQTVYIQVTYTTRASTAPVQAVKPVWLDIDQCGDSRYSIPAGFSDTHWDWNVNLNGKIVAAAGHVHGYGVAVEATNESKGGKSICRSEATLGEDPHQVMSMSTCAAGSLGAVKRGETVRLHSEYDSMHAAVDAMGIMIMYIRSG